MERDTYFTVYPNLNDSSEGTGQSKKRQILGQRQMEGRQGTGVAGMGDAQQAWQSRDGWPGLGKRRGQGPLRGPRRSRLGP